MAPTRRSTLFVLPVAAVVLMVAGVIAIVISTSQDASFGWFAYAPLSGTVFTPHAALVVGRGAVAGAVVAVLGLAALAFWGGYRLATSRAKRAR
ncbi:hypothetical protein VD659_02140 [Herbiconiux sp. 11R-BC]|uniref:hypothetical protein n=1 Tax=Herbiconiux sp. 11R-BC TaxID=3111637 RepID=UPI003BFC62C3